VEDDIKIKMSTAEIFNKPKAFEELGPKILRKGKQ